MNRTIALAAAAAFLASTTLVTAFYAPGVRAPSNVQFAQAMKDDMKKDYMAKDDMKKDTMAKDDMKKKDDMMKKDDMKKN
jgi:pentapeptide MXKDX repeat protein